MPSDSTGNGILNGRINGRFAKGNQCAKGGGAFSSHVAAIKREFFQAVKEGDVAAVVQKMLTQAKAGDVAAAKFLFDRLLGKPHQSIEISSEAPLFDREAILRDLYAAGISYPDDTGPQEPQPLTHPGENHTADAGGPAVQQARGGTASPTREV